MHLPIHRLNRLAWYQKYDAQAEPNKHKALQEMMDDNTVCSAFCKSEEERKASRFPIWVETETEVGFPMVWALGKQGIGMHFRKDRGIPEDQTPPGDRIDDSVVFMGQLDDEFKQIQASEAMKAEQARGARACKICLPCGFGKTVLACHEIGRTRLKTLVLVPTRKLHDQWLQRIGKFLPNARVGSLFQSKVQIKDKDVVVGIMKSVAGKDYPEGTFDSFGMLLVDEAHKVAARTMVQCVQRTIPKWTVALSATPERSDKLDVILDRYFGRTAFRTERRDANVSIEMIMAEWPAVDPRDSSMEAKGAWMSKLSVNLDRNRCAAQHMHRVLMSDPGRNMIAFSDSVVNLALIYVLLEEMLPPEIAQSMSMFAASGLKDNDKQKTLTKAIRACPEHLQDRIATLTKPNGMTPKELEAVTETPHRCLFATYQLASTGLDVDYPNTEILLTPHSGEATTTQTVGRVTRGGFASRACKPLILDLVDPCRTGIQRGNARLMCFLKMQFSVFGSAMHLFDDIMEEHAPAEKKQEIKERKQAQAEREAKRPCLIDLSRD